MTTQPTTSREHPLAVLVARLHDELDEAVGLPVWSLDPVGAGAVLTSLTRLAARVASLELTVAGHARSVAVEDLDGAVSTANWWAHHTHATRAETHRKLRVAAALDSHPSTAEGLAAGRVLPDQAAVIVDAVDALPDDLEPELVVEAEAHLLGLAADFDAKALRQLGKGLLTVVAPEVGEAHEAAALAREEREAAASARLSMVDDGHGRVHGRFTLPLVQGAMLKKALLAIAAPEAPGRSDRARTRTSAGRGICWLSSECVQRASVSKPPKPGQQGRLRGFRPRSSLALVAAQPTVPTVNTRELLSAGAARRLACKAGVIPAVLGGPSQVLDLGRTRRFHTKAQRIAMGLRDRGCTAEACDWPPGLCHTHHDQPWHHGGHTDTRTGRLLCPRHHARAHDPTYETTHLPGGKVAFTTRE